MPLLLLLRVDSYIIYYYYWWFIANYLNYWNVGLYHCIFVASQNNTVAKYYCLPLKIWPVGKFLCSVQRARSSLLARCKFLDSARARAHTPTRTSATCPDLRISFKQIVTLEPSHRIYSVSSILVYHRTVHQINILVRNYPTNLNSCPLVHCLNKWTKVSPWGG